jgi:beta-N-acetylhexosaminidase
MATKIDLSIKPFHLSQKSIDWVEKTLNNLSIEHKVGQLFCINAKLAGKKDMLDILQYNPGGVFLSMHFKGHQQKSIRFLQDNSEIPLLVAGDLEAGGLAGAINGTFFGSPMGVGATNDEGFAYKLGKVIGTEGSAMGFNTTYAPVVDINYNYRNSLVNLRAFGDTPEIVLRMAKAHIKGVQECGMVATAKHWPGDGVDDRNMHYVTTHNSLSMEDWNKSFGKVYQGVIDSGVLSIMSTHIDLPAYDRLLNPDIYARDIVPASINPDLNFKLLREKFGFNGMIVSDATGMTGLISHGKREELVPKIIASGVDLYLFSRRKRDFDLMLNGVQTGIISKERLNDAVTRILALKAAIGLPEKQKKGTLVPPKSALKLVACKEHKQWALDCARKSITLVKNLENVIPLQLQKFPRILLIRGGDFSIITRKFKGLLKKRGFKVTNYKQGQSVSKTHFDLVIYLVNQPGMFDKNNIQLDWRKIGGMKWFSEIIPTVFISLGSPYHLYDVPRMKTFINTYNFHPRAMKALVEVLTGELPFSGISPVDAFCGLEDAHF